MVAARPALAELWDVLARVPDPEIPVISIVDLGIVRDLAYVERDGETVLVAGLTPTYSGCPALRTIERDVATALHGAGVARVDVETRLAPAWTTDWMSAAGREKLRAYGISPPRIRAVAPTGVIDLLGYADERAACPRCGSADVALTSRFGSTPCKSLYRCNACREPFDHFKSH